MTKHYHDHEQEERDYYDRSFTRRHEFAWWSLKLLVKWLPAMLLLSWLLFGCATATPIATSSTGTVIEVDGDQVLVTFSVVNKRYSDQAMNWFYIPGHTYEKGDRYPDPDKDPSIKSPFDSPDRSGQAAQGDNTGSSRALEGRESRISRDNNQPYP